MALEKTNRINTVIYFNNDTVKGSRGIFMRTEVSKVTEISWNFDEFRFFFNFWKLWNYSPSEKSPSLARSSSNCSRPFSIAEKSLKRIELGGLLRLESRFCPNARDPRDTNLSKNGRIWRPKTPEFIILKDVGRLISETFENFHFEGLIIILEGKITKMITRVNFQIFTTSPSYHFYDYPSKMTI